MSDELKLPQVGELTFSQWQDWLARYNAVLAERDSRIEKLEEALNCNLPDYDPKIGIVERLRQLGNWRVDGTKSSPIYNKSADHIEKLEATLRALKALHHEGGIDDLAERDDRTYFMVCEALEKLSAP